MIKLFTDTSSNLPLKLIRRFDISVVPFSYTVDGREAAYAENTEYDGAAFYGAMRDGAQVKTSMINTETFMKSFEPAAANGCDIMYVGMSGGISGAYNSAAVAVQRLSQRYPELSCVAIDTYAASLGEGMLVLKAAELIQRGCGFEDVKRTVLKLRGHVCQFFTVDDLVYLKRGGRISGAAALVGSMLNIKPILRGDETGHIVMCDKVRGGKKALEYLADKYARLVLDKALDVGIAHADNEDGADQLLALLKQHGLKGDCQKVCYEPVTGAHVGPGTVALFFYGINK